MKKQIKVGNVIIGNPNHIPIQSMTNTKTKNIDETVSLINRLTDAGCEIIRVAVVDLEDAQAIKEIKKLISIPIVADIHYDYRLAIASIEAGADKIRINPGNIPQTEDLYKVIDKAEEYNIPIRIGFNSGSIDDITSNKHKLDELEKTISKYVKLFEERDFTNLCISVKMTDPLLTIEANRLCNKLFNYPLHIGLTEAGNHISGTIRSSYVLGTLLAEGIGDTIRVSLTADPVKEIEVAKEILKIHGLYKGITLISCPTCGRCNYDMMKIVDEMYPHIMKIDKELTVAIMGCSVNGPGEAKDADLGIAGGKNEALLFKKGKPIRKIPQDQIITELLNEINEY